MQKIINCYWQSADSALLTALRPSAILECIGASLLLLQGQSVITYLPLPCVLSPVASVK